MALCPHCLAPLPDPPPAQCPSCGGVLSASEPPPPPAPEAGQALPPPLPAAFEAPPTGGTPWDERDRLGLAGAFVETTRRVLTRPTAFFRQMPVTGGLGSPLLYAVIAGWIGLAAAAFYQAIWVSIVGPASLPFGLEGAEFAEVLGFLESWAGLVAQLIFGAVWVVIATFVTSGILHVALLLLGGTRRDFEATFRVVSFSQATMLLFVIPLFLVPFCGLALVVWSLVLYVIGTAEAHQIGHGKATAAVLLPLALACCCCAGIAVIFFGAITSLVGQIH